MQRQACLTPRLAASRPPRRGFVFVRVEIEGARRRWQGHGKKPGMIAQGRADQAPPGATQWHEASSKVRRAALPEGGARLISTAVDPPGDRCAGGLSVVYGLLGSRMRARNIAIVS